MTVIVFKRKKKYICLHNASILNSMDYFLQSERLEIVGYTC